MRACELLVEGFDEWFGDSVTVSNDGKPVVFYHGSDKEFDEFKPTSGLRGDGGIFEVEVTSPFKFFTPDINYAYYAADAHGGENKIYKVYLRITNPLDLRTVEGRLAAHKIYNILHSDEIEEKREELKDIVADYRRWVSKPFTPSEYMAWESIGPNGEIYARSKSEPRRNKEKYTQRLISKEEDKQLHDQLLKGMKDDVETAKKELKQAYINAAKNKNMMNVWELFDEENSDQMLKKAGYDGVIFIENDGELTYAVPDANQIKSVKNKTFNPQSSNIYESINVSDSTFRKAAQEMIDFTDWGGGDGEYYCEEYIRDNDIKDEDGYWIDSADVDVDSRHFLDWVYPYFEDRCRDALNRIGYGCTFNNGKIVIWREIHSEKKFLTVIRNRGLGEYWAWDEHAAEAHWGGSGMPVLMKSEASYDQIDWPITLSQNASDSYSDEREIRIKDGEHLALTGLFYSHGNGWEEIDISSIEGETFPVT